MAMQRHQDEGLVLSTPRSVGRNLRGGLLRHRPASWEWELVSPVDLPPMDLLVIPDKVFVKKWSPK